MTTTAADMRASLMASHAIVTHAYDVLFVIDPGGRILECNARAEELLGRPAADIRGRDVWDFQPPRAIEIARAAVLRTFAQPSGITDAIPVLRPDGEVRLVDFSFSSVGTGDQRTILSIGRDVTDRVRAIEAARASEARYRALVDNLPGMVWSADAAGRIDFCSGRAADVTGFTPEELVAGGAAMWIARAHPDDQPSMEQELARLVATGVPFDSEFRFQRKDGRWIWLNGRATLTRDAAGASHVDGLVTEVTDRKRLEEQLLHSQKLEAVGQLTGGIAHDFNNLLAVILSNLGFVLEDLAAGDPRRNDVAEARAAAERAAGLTRQLLAFSRRQILEPTVVDVGAIVGSMNKMLRRVIGEDIELEVRTAADAGAVRADAGQLEQVIINLVVNARDAMPGGGRLVIETACARVDTVSAATHQPMRPGMYVRLSVADSGCGMDELTRQRIFEPFFTTKGAGKGTGLGLSTCYGIVKQSDGFIWVESAPGAGARFDVYLPCVEEEAPAVAAAAPGAEWCGNETVLLVEDDEGVRKAAWRVLTSRGYEVTAAADGAEALALCGRDGKFDLVLSDVVMPKLSGPDLLEGIGRLCPNARVILMSGYTEHPMLVAGKLPPGVAFLQKPFTPESLARKVRETLGTVRAADGARAARSG